MKKNKHNNAPVKKKSVKTEEKEPEKKSDKAPPKEYLDDEEQDFGNWLWSTDGLDNLKLFVIANSIVLLTTITYPQIQTCFQIVYEMIYGEDNLYT